MRAKAMGMGKNRTGIGTSPIDAKATIEGAEQGVPIPTADGEAIADVRREYARVADGVGSVPPPTTLRGVARSVGQLIKGNHPTVLIDKLAERLAFERTGTRLYEGLIAKMEAAGPADGISIRVARRFHDEERAHMGLVVEALEQIGADPTAQTPSADVDGVAASGLLQVITDPRTSVLHALHAIHIAELADNDGWAMLIELAEAMGLTDLAQRFGHALAEEEEHLEAVRDWMITALAREAGVELSSAEPPKPGG